MHPLPTPLPPAPSAPIGAAEEAALVARARSGDRAAFDELAVAAMPMLLGTAMRLLGDRLGAEEAVADALFRAFRKLSSFQGHSRFSTWTHRILCRAVADRVRLAVRDRQRRQKLAQAATEAHPPSALHHLEAGEEGRRLRAAVEGLPPTQRLVILLVVWEGLSLKDTAEVTGQRYRTVKSNLHHARRALGRALEEGASS